MSIDPQDIKQLETEIQAIEWENVSLEPDPTEVERLDQELPTEWTHTLEPELDAEYTPDELDDLLNSDLDIPPGDIDQNAQDALQELDIDLDAIAQERDLDIDIDIEQDFDFGR
jgi:hypothetical protein